MKIYFKILNQHTNNSYFSKEFNVNDYNALKEMSNAIKNYKSFENSYCLLNNLKLNEISDFKSNTEFNFPYGEIILFKTKFDLARTDIGNLTPEQYYVGQKLVSQETFNIFMKYIGKRKLYKIKTIKIENEIVFQES